MQFGFLLRTWSVTFDFVLLLAYLRQAGLKGKGHWDFGSGGFDTDFNCRALEIHPPSDKLHLRRPSSAFGGQVPPTVYLTEAWRTSSSFGLSSATFDFVLPLGPTFG